MKGCNKLKKEVLNTVFGSCPIDMSDEDILDAMKSIPGYLDITPGDLVLIKQRLCSRFNAHRFRKRHNANSSSHGIWRHSSIRDSLNFCRKKYKSSASTRSKGPLGGDCCKSRYFPDNVRPVNAASKNSYYR
jgi:hypothetical protein